jgi:arsenical pump membrane protein
LIVLTLCVFAATLALVMVRPKPFNEATAAALGAAVMLISGIVTPTQALQVLEVNANVLLFFLGLMLICTVADRAGFFEWCAFKAVKMACGSGTRLLAVVFGLGALITAFFSNDATALVLTPIVFVLVSRLKLDPLPYVFACAFIANSASMLLPVSNPVNLLAVGRFDITLGEYFKFLLLPSVLVVLVNMGLFALIFRKTISGSSCGDLPGQRVKVDAFFQAVCSCLGLIALGYVVSSAYGLALAWPALAGGILLLAVGFGFGRLKIRTVASGLSWFIFLFIFSLAVLVKGLDNAGVTAALASGLANLASNGQLHGLFAAVLGTAMGSNLINNWSMMMVSVSSLGALAGQPAFSPALVYGAVMGADLGPNIAILGSLSSMLWLLLLRQRGLDIRPVQYLKLGLIVTPPLLIIGTLALYACSRLWG